jgi:hypothetical protein
LVQPARRPTSWLGTLIVVAAIAALCVMAATRMRKAVRPGSLDATTGAPPR